MQVIWQNVCSLAGKESATLALNAGLPHVTDRGAPQWRTRNARHPMRVARAVFDRVVIVRSIVARTTAVGLDCRRPRDSSPGVVSPQW